MAEASLSMIRVAVERSLAQKTKPAGALDRVDALALQMALAQETEEPQALPATALVFAADHGVSLDGVSAYPREVTAQMVLNFIGGGAAVCTFAKAAGADVAVYDVGVDADDFTQPGIQARKIARGTKNLRLQAAMSPKERDEALAVGQEALERAVSQGARVVTIGEMGIGNTTSASALTAALLGTAVADVVGPGTGVQGAALEAKKRVVGDALARLPTDLSPLDYLQELGGLEIVAMVGVCLAAPRHRCVVVVDGFIAGVAALYAQHMDQRVEKQLLWGHRSSEPGHDIVLRAAKAQPILDLQLRLGEGSGAMLALPILHAACVMLRDMATFASAGVSDREENA